MRVRIDESEWYPVYSIQTELTEHARLWGIDIPDEIVKDFKERFKDFGALQSDVKVWLSKQYSQPIYKQ